MEITSTTANQNRMSDRHKLIVGLCVLVCIGLAIATGVLFHEKSVAASNDSLAPATISLPAGAVPAPQDVNSDYARYMAIDKTLIDECRSQKLNISDSIMCENVLLNFVKARIPNDKDYQPQYGSYIPKTLKPVDVPTIPPTAATAATPAAPAKK